jgi:hypothetical protein
MTMTGIESVTRDVIRYFLDHPELADSLEGIAHWRLMTQRVREVVGETERALSILVERGLIRRIAVSGGPVLFRLDPAKREDAERLMEELE